MRAPLGRRVRIHTNPELRFVHDRSVERGVDLSHLIDVANASRAADDLPSDVPRPLGAAAGDAAPEGHTDGGGAPPTPSRSAG